jgi:hypothetical protein
VTTSITLGHWIVAKATLKRISISPVVGAYELLFTVEGSSTTRDDQILWLSFHRADVKVGAGQGELSRLGTARPDASHRIRTFKNALPFNCEFRLLLAPNQLSAIEELRTENDLQFQIAVSGEGGDETTLTEIQTFTQPLFLSVPRSEWISQLRAARATDVLLLEVPMPFIDPPGQMIAVVEALKRAQSHFIGGHYSDCIINCRKAIEELETLQGRDRTVAFGRLANDRKGMSKDERRTAIEAALFHFASLAAHDAGTEFDRRDARLAMTLAAGLVAHGVN